MKLVVINYLPINYFKDSFWGGKAHLRALLAGFASNKFYIIQLGGLAKPIIKYNRDLKTLHLNIFPYKKKANEIATTNSSSTIIRKNSSLIVKIFKIPFIIIFSIAISIIAIFIRTYYYERANKNFTFRPHFLQKKILEINDSYIPNDYFWFDVIACVDKPTYKSERSINHFINPWPSELSYHIADSKVINKQKLLNLIIINSSPYGVSTQNINSFIKTLKIDRLDVVINYLGKRDDVINSILHESGFTVNFYNLLPHEEYISLINTMEIAFVSYGDELSSDQLKIAVPMKILDLLASGVKVFCDQHFTALEQKRYKEIVTHYNCKFPRISLDNNNIDALTAFAHDVNPTLYVKKLITS